VLLDAPDERRVDLLRCRRRRRDAGLLAGAVRAARTLAVEDPRARRGPRQSSGAGAIATAQAPRTQVSGAACRTRGPATWGLAGGIATAQARGACAPLRATFCVFRTTRVRGPRAPKKSHREKGQERRERPSLEAHCVPLPPRSRHNAPARGFVQPDVWRSRRPSQARSAPERLRSNAYLRQIRDRVQRCCISHGNNCGSRGMQICNRYAISESAVARARPHAIRRRASRMNSPLTVYVDGSRR